MDGGVEWSGDGQGGYEPTVPIAVAPMFERPPRLLGSLRFFAWKQFWPGGAMWIGVAWLSWHHLRPDLATTSRAYRGGLDESTLLRLLIDLALPPCPCGPVGGPSSGQAPQVLWMK